ncbi:MAG TPA: hypothetical protein VF713_03070 [Thermoanaerobaculia bacterium]
MRHRTMTIGLLAITTLALTARVLAAQSTTRRDSVTSTGLVLHGNPDRVQVVTSDISRFWRAFDAAASKDSAERVRIAQEFYRHAADRRAALRELLALTDADRILLQSEYGQSFAADSSGGPR